MDLEQVVQAVAIENKLRTMQRSVSEEMHPAVALIADEIDKAMVPFVSLITSGVRQGYDFEIIDDANYFSESMLPTLELLAEDVGISIEAEDSLYHVSAKKGSTLTASCQYENSNQDMLVRVFKGDMRFSRDSDIEPQLQKIIDANGSIEVLLHNPNKPIRNKAKKHFAGELAKKIANGKGDGYIAIEMTDSGFVLTSQREVVTVPLSGYAAAQTYPGSFAVTSEILSKANGVKPAGLLESVGLTEGSDPDFNTAAITVYAAMQARRYRGLENSVRVLEAEGDSLGLVAEYKTNLKEYRKSAKKAIKAIADSSMSIGKALSFLSESEKKAYQSEFGDDFSDIQGLLGEAVSLGLLKWYSKPNPEFEIFTGKPGSTVYDQASGYELRFSSSGRNVEGYHKKTGHCCEVDNIVNYNGIPIIFETKTGYSPEIDSSLVRKQRRFVNAIFGVKPIFVELRFGETKSFQQIGSDSYEITSPWIRPIRHMANNIHSNSYPLLKQ